MCSIRCAISGEIANEPVVSLKSHKVFEKRLLEKHIVQFNEDPITRESMSMQDVIQLDVGENNFVAPKMPQQSASIPNMLKAFQDEWDSVTLQNYSMKRENSQLRQELTHYMYQHDAACRVISRLRAEAKELRNVFNMMKPQEGINNSANLPVSEANVELGLTEDIQNRIGKTAEILQSARRERLNKLKEGVDVPELKSLPVEKIEQFQETHRVALHSVGVKGIQCMDLQVSSGRVVTGGADKVVIVYDRSKGAIEANLTGHTGSINRVVYHPDSETVFSGSDDGTVRIWDVNNQKCLQSFRVKANRVSGLVILPTKDLLAAASHDELTLFDLNTSPARKAVSFTDPDSLISTCCDVHPDGQIMAVGCDKHVIRLWDVKTGQSPHFFEEGMEGKISSLSFADNGTSLISASTDGYLRAWDLRKLKCIRREALVPFKNNLPTSVVIDVRIDQASKYVAIATSASDAGIYSFKGFSAISPLDSHDGSLVSGIRFGPQASYVVTSCMDRNLRFFSVDENV